MSPPYRLIGEMVSQDTVEVLTELLEDAKRGHVIGVSLVAMRRRKQYEFATTGELARSPTFALGTITKLAFDLAQRVNEGT